jgi:hypothetical protein
MTKTIYDDLQKELSSALRQLNSNFGYDSYDVIVRHGEINHQHGVGILVQRIFPKSSNFFPICSKTNFPILVVGGSNSAVAQFVQEYGIVCRYAPDGFSIIYTQKPRLFQTQVFP